MADSEAKSDRRGGEKRRTDILERKVNYAAYLTWFHLCERAISIFYKKSVRIQAKDNPKTTVAEFEAVLAADNKVQQCERRFNMLTL